MSKFNKVITNVPVSLDETEVDNLSQTLSGLLNGGGGEGKIYEGDGVYIDVDNTHITGKITLTQTAKTKLDTPIPTQVSDLTDSANYETTEHANATYLTPASADTLYAPLSVTGDIEYLSGEFNNYYKKTETSSKEQLSDEFEKYQLKSDMEFYATDDELSDLGDSLGGRIANKQDKLTFGYDIKNAISSINGSALAGGSGEVSGNYKAGTDILILDEYSTIQINTNGTANSAGMAFVEGSDNIASGVASHAEGKETSAMSDYSHTEGYRNNDFAIPGQIGSNHTEGAYNNVSGVYTHIEGHANEITGYGLHVQGGYNQFAIHNMSANKSDPDGRWNIWGISIEGMANATTAEPYSGTIGQPDFGYIHGGILKVIGNGTRTKTDESDPSTEVINRSDALIIYRDGCISAAGNISANGIELGAGGGTSYQGRSGVNVDGDYIELTQTAYNAVTSVSSKVDKPTSLVDKYLVLRTDNAGDVSGWVDLKDNFYSKSESDGRYQKKTDMSSYLTTEQYATDSATFVTETELETVSGEITALIPTNYVTSGDEVSGDKQYALTTAGWVEITSGSIGDDYVPYSATKLAIGSNNDISENNSDNSFAQGTNNKISTSNYSFAQGQANSAVNSYSLSQGYANYAQNISLAQGSYNNANTLSFAQGQHNSATSYTFTQGTNNSALTTSFAQGSANRARYDSFAQGNSNSAFSQSLAQGHYNSADDGSFAQGKYNTAYSHSFTQGANNYADNNAMAQGGDNTAKYFSQALGFGLSIQGSRGSIDGTDYVSGGLAIGTYNQTSSNVAFVVGNGHTNGVGEEPTRSDAFLIYPDGSVSAAGKISANGVELGAGGGSLTLPVNVGTGNDVSQTSSIGAIGNNCSAGTKSFAFSYKGATAYENSFAVNDDNIAGHNSFAWGWGSTADAYSMAGGNNVSASGHSFVLAQGDSTAKSQANNYSIAFGNAVTANNWSYVFGRGLNFSGSDDATTGIGALVVGGWNNTTADALFVLANGTSNNNRSDAFIVYRNGAVNAGYVNTNTVNGSYSFIEGRDNHDVGAAGCNHIEGGYNSLSGLYSHAEGNLNTMSADHSHIEGYRNEFNTSTYDWGIHIGGMLNATTAQTNDHGGILRLIGNGTRQKVGSTENITRSDAYILYRDGTVKAKDFIAGGNTLSANYPVPKSVPNTADNTLKIQRMFVCTSDNDIIAHVNAGLAEGEGCVFFRVGN